MRIIVPSLALVFASLGCASPPPAPVTPSADGADAGASDPKVSQEGGECGDDVAIQKKCAAGLVCAPKPNAPVSEHTPGVCKKQ